MAVTSFIPELWSARLLAHLDNAHVAKAFVNSDYEGEIRQLGDRVHINSIGDITIKDYTRNADIDDPEELATDKQTLLINNAKYFNFAVDDVDRIQSAGPLIDSATQRASYGIADAVDQKIFATIAAAAKSANTIGSASSPIEIASPEEAYAQLVALRTLMAKANVPAITWQVACGSDFVAYLLQDDRFVKSGTDAGESRLQNGFVGRAAGFSIYESNNVPANNVLASPAFATTFAEQITELEAYRPEKRFADAVKGLNVYGVKTIYPEAVAKLIYQ